MSISRELSKFIEPGGQLEYDNTTSGLSATTIKSAIDELNTLLGGGNVGSQATFDVYEFTATASQTTFSLSSNHGQGSDITAGNFVDGTTYIITSVGTTDFVTLYGASSNTVGVTFTANTNPGTGTGTAKVVADYIPGFIKVYLNGVLLSETDYVASDGDNVVLDVGADVGALLSVVVLDSFNTATQLRVLGIDAGAPDNSVNVDASGNLLVGTTDPVQFNTSTITGWNVNNIGQMAIAADGLPTSYFNRLTSDGDIAIFRRDGATVGSIGGNSASLYIADDDTGLFFNRASNNILPYRNDVGNEGPTNGTIDLGRATAAFKRMYLTDGINDSGQDGSETVFNEGSTTADFRIESNDDTHMFFVDGGLNSIGIGNASPSSYNAGGNQLVVGSGSGFQGITVASGAAQSGNIYFADGTTGNETYRGHITYDHSDDHMHFKTAAVERIRIDANGTLLVNDTSARTYDVYGGSTSAGMQLAEASASSAFSINRYGDVPNGAQIVLAHSRGATVGTNTIVADDDPLGIINFDGANGTGYDIAAQIRGEVDGTPGATTDMPGRLTFWTTANASATPSERMRIDSAGYVGINKINPETLLQIGNPNNRLIGEEHQIVHSTFDLFTNWQSDTAGKGAIITFSDYYNDGAFQRTTRAGIKGVTRYAGNDASGALVFYTNENASDSLFPRMTIDETGKVGIRSGTGGYASTWLHVDGDPTVGTIGTTEVFRVGRPLTNAVSFDQYAAFKIGRHTTPSGSFESFTRLDIDLRDDSSTPNSDTNVMTLLNNGYVGIGTTNPTDKVSVEFTGASENGISIKTTTASNGSKFLSFVDSAGSEIGYVEENTSTTVNYSTSSDQRLKENIVDAPSASDDIDAIQVRSFDWKADGSHRKYGMIAQELVTVAPEAVSQREDPEAMMGVDYSKLVPMMLKEIQSLRARVAQLESN